MFPQDKYNEILENCNDFKQRYVAPNEKEVYVQLVHENDEFDSLQVTFDVYPEKFLYRLMDYALTPRLPEIPLFSYCFETKVDKESHTYKEVKTVAQKNNGWLKATLCDRDNCDFYGQLIWQCGGVDYTEIGLKMQYNISDSDMRMKNNCVPIVSSGYIALYRNNQQNYQTQYDQGIFLQNCGVATPLLF